MTAANRHAIAFAVGAALTLTITVASNAQAGTPRNATSTTTLSAATLTPEEIDSLAYMREEEKLAMDVYNVLYATWGTPVFDSIALSESAHTTAVLTLINQYSLPDPAATNPPGVYLDASLQALHDQLVAQGMSSEVEALRVGALIEETDIKDIRERMALTDEAPILKVYDNLLCGSRNHLRSFDKNLQMRGVDYTPVVISEAEWDAIASSPMERCR
jgi:hypothetical protein